MSTEFKHTPVMLTECIDNLHLKKNGVALDATLGGAGHSVEIAKRLGAQGKLIGIDQDEMALRAAEERLEALPSKDKPAIELLHGNFGDLDNLLLQAEVPGVDFSIFDLGLSSPQIDTLQRGFSFKEENAPLDMRMNPGKQTLTAAEIVNTYEESQLARIIRDYSDEKWASRIARFIVKARETKPFETSGQLVDAIKAAIPASARREGGHPAKRTFQALRIEVNGELEVLKKGLDAAIRWLNPGGRIVVMSYHSLEDKIVKDLFSRYEHRCTCPPDLPLCACGKRPSLEVITRKPILPTEEEINRNPRARSARLRVAERL